MGQGLCSRCTLVSCRLTRGHGARVVGVCMLVPAASLISQGTAHAAACGAGGTGGTGGVGGASTFGAGGVGGVGGVGGASAGCDQNGEDGLFDTSDFNAPQTQQAIDGDVINVFTDNEF